MPNHEEPPPAPSRRWLLVCAKAAVAAVVVVAVSGTLRSAISELRQSTLSASLPLAVAAGLICVAAYAPMAFFWRGVLAAWGQPCAWADVLRSYYVGHVGKYVPGKAMVVVLRTGLLVRRGGRAGTIAASVFVETLTLMAVGGAIAGVVLSTTSIGEGQPAWLTSLAFGLAVASAAPSIPPVMNRLVAWYEARRGGEGPSAPLEYTWGLFGAGWLFGGATWCGLAASLWVSVRAIDGQFAASTSGALACLLAATLPVVAGFLSLIPGGLVVRDGLMVALLAPAAGADVALAATLLVRVTWVAAEAAVCGILMMRVPRTPTGDHAG